MIVFNINHGELTHHHSDNEGVAFSIMFKQIEGGLDITKIPQRVIVYNNHDLAFQQNRSGQLVVPYGQPEVRKVNNSLIQLFINPGDAATAWGVWMGEGVKRVSPANTIMARKSLIVAQRKLDCIVTIPQAQIISGSEVWHFLGEFWKVKSKPQF